MEKKDKKRRFDYLDDFKADDNGNYTYRGNIYEVNGDWKKAYLYLWLTAGGAFVCQILCGCLPAPGMFSTSYVIIPYALAVLMLGLTVCRMVNLSFAGQKIREYIFKKTVDRFEPELYIAAAFMGITFIGEFIHDVRTGLSSWTFVFAGVQALGIALCICFTRYLNSIEWNTVQERKDKQEGE